MDIDQIQPDLLKAPPHVEGELLKQSTKKTPVMSKWRKFFFVIHKDKLQYFNKKEDYQLTKNPINVIRLSRVSDISESVFNKVPRKTHLNSGFSLIEKTTQGEQVYNLLADSPDMMRYWVHALRYVKAYWSKKEIRDTIINDDMDRKLIDQALREEEEETELGENLYVGEYSLQDGGHDQEYKSVTISVHFADSSKVACKVFPMDQVSDLLDKVSDKLSSSVAQIWIVDNNGKEHSLDPDDPLDLHQPFTQQFLAVDPTHRVIVVFLDESKEFVATIVPCKITAQEVLLHPDIVPKLDMIGVANRGLFLKTPTQEQLFEASECPCAALYTEMNGMIQRVAKGGHLLIKNKALDRGRPSKWKHSKSIIPNKRNSDSTNVLQRELEEEEAEQRALIRAQEKRKIIAQRGYHPIQQIKESEEADIEDDDDDDDDDNVNPYDKKSFTPPTSHRSLDTSSLDKHKRSKTEVYRQGRPRAFVQATLDFPQSVPNKSPLSSPKRILPTVSKDSTPTSQSLPPSINLTPSSPPPPSVPNIELSATDGSSEESSGTSPLIRKRAIRGRSSSSFVSSHHQTVKKRTESILADLIADDSRSSTFANTSTVPKDIDSSCAHDEDEKKMEQLFSTSYQVKEDEERIKAELERQTSSDTAAAVRSPSSKPDSPETVMSDPKTEEESEEELPSSPLFIQFDSLRQVEPVSSSSVAAPIVIHRPSILKIILMQSYITTTSSPTDTSQDMSLISLSGVVLRKRRNTWQLQDGSQFHDPSTVPQDSNLEKYQLPGDITALYNNTESNWYVLPSSALATTTSHPPHHTHTTTNTTEAIRKPPIPPQIHSNDDLDSEALKLYAHHQYLQKRAIVTEIGSSFNELLELFKDCKSSEEKRNIGSDMTNSTIGHMVRGRFCTSIVALILDGLRVQKLGFMQQDAWKVINAFCQEGYSLYAASSANIYITIESKILKAIKGEGRLTTNHMRFRAFVCLCISRGLFLQWLTDLPLFKDTIRKNYSQDSMLYLMSIARDPTYEKLYEEILLSLQPLPYIPFQLSLTFEVVSTELLPNVGASNSRSVSPSPMSQQQVESQTKSVMESTGQRSSEVTSFINENFIEDTSSYKLSQQRKMPPLSSTTVGNVFDRFTVDNLSKSTSGPTWLKKIASGIGNLNVGGVITGTPQTTIPSSYGDMKSAPSSSGSIEASPRASVTDHCYVEALFDNVEEVGSKELKFHKGDTLKVEKTIDENWLLCVKGTDSGIVPVNYVKVIH